MAFCPSSDLVCGWVSGPNKRGTINIVWSSLSTIWLCTWTALCLNVPDDRTRGWRFVLYKFRWQLFAIFFPEVLVALAAEQWVSARQSIQAFKDLGHSDWTIRHGFFGDMGGIMIAPRGYQPFPVDSYQLAYLIRHGFIVMPQINIDDIKAVNKADGLARSMTMFQMGWFCVSCLGRGITGLVIAPFELETLAFILCTLHTFFFWWHKPLDPSRPMVIPLSATIDEICIPNHDPAFFERTPLDFIRPASDPKSLIAPFWFGFKATFGFLKVTPPAKLSSAALLPKQTIANSTIHPTKGIGWGLTIYLLVFQLMFYGLHIGVAWKVPFPSHIEFLIYEISNIIDLGLIALFVLALPLGSHYAPFIGRVIFNGQQASTVLEVANMLPGWAKVVLHGPFVIGYILARLMVLVAALVALRAMPPAIYDDLDWSNFLPHI